MRPDRCVGLKSIIAFIQIYYRIQIYCRIQIYYCIQFSSRTPSYTWEFNKILKDLNEVAHYVWYCCPAWAAGQSNGLDTRAHSLTYFCWL
jgi:hypothetical protein